MAETLRNILSDMFFSQPSVKMGSSADGPMLDDDSGLRREPTSSQIVKAFPHNTPIMAPCMHRKKVTIKLRLPIAWKLVESDSTLLFCTLQQIFLTMC